MDYKQKAKQLQKDKRALLRQLRSLQRNIREYDQTILNRIIENKNIKLEEYKDKNIKR
jgi:multidrug resistance efflux pump